MLKKVKLIWDFKGDNTFEMATHYNKHLIEFFDKKKIELIKSGVEIITENYHLSFAIVNEKDVNSIKHPLKPHRALLIST